MNILDMLKDQVTGSLAKQASGFLGENESAVTSALGSAFPAILGGMIDKGTSEKGAAGLMGMIDGLDMNMLGNIGNVFGGGASSVNGLLNSGGGILDMVLGDKLGGVASLISKVSGLGSGSSSSLLKMAAPFLMGIIGKQISGKGPGALIDLLMGQKDHVAKAMPSGMGSLLGLANLGGLGDGLKNVVGSAADTAGNVANSTAGAVRNVGATATNVASSAAGTATDAAKSGFGWLKAALPLLILAGLAWWFLGKGGADKMKNAANTAIETTADAAGTVANAAGDAAGAVKDGAVNAADAVANATSSAFSTVNEAAKSALDKITFTAGSAGSQMMEFIDGGFKGNDSFRFNNVNFASGSAKLTAESAAEIDNLAAILKAYEGVNVEIQGYTDNQGDPAKNVTLSQARATSVLGRLMAQGVDAKRMKPVGFGEANPVADNNTAEGRAANRRIEVKLVK